MIKLKALTLMVLMTTALLSEARSDAREQFIKEQDRLCSDNGGFLIPNNSDGLTCTFSDEMLESFHAPLTEEEELYNIFADRVNL